jgi:hypothetical protein
MISMDPLNLDDLRDDPEGREFRRRHAPRIRVDAVTRTEVRRRPDGSVEIRYADGTTDLID